MSSTLTWASSGLGAKTGTTNAAFLDDLDTLIASKSGDPTFFWEKAGKSNSGTPRYLLLRRKDGSAGRIAIIIWDSNPAANNSAILDQTPTNNGVFIAWFPSGTGTTLSNLTAASGTICGNDTGVVKCQGGTVIGTSYAANLQHFYFDSYDYCVFCTQDPGAQTSYAIAAGLMLVDAADTAYDGVFSTSGTGRWDAFSTTANSPFPWLAAAQLAGSANQSCIRTNYGSANRNYFFAYVPSGAWSGIAPATADILTDTGANKAWFVAPQLLGQAKGEGPVLKLRQIGMGSGGSAALQAYNLTGPVVAARLANARASGAINGPAWMTNFKI